MNSSGGGIYTIISGGDTSKPHQQRAPIYSPPISYKYQSHQPFPVEAYG